MHNILKCNYSHFTDFSLCYTPSFSPQTKSLLFFINMVYEIQKLYFFCVHLWQVSFCARNKLSSKRICSSSSCRNVVDEWARTAGLVVLSSRPLKWKIAVATVFNCRVGTFKDIWETSCSHPRISEKNVTTRCFTAATFENKMCKNKVLKPKFTKFTKKKVGRSYRFVQISLN